MILISRIHNFDNIKRGDIIVFDSKELNKKLVKRLIGIPGDKIEIKDGIIFLNGEQLKEDYVKNKDKYNGEFDVPEGMYFFLGDNRPISDDARFWGNHYIDSSNINGKAQIIFFPFKDFNILN